AAISRPVPARTPSPVSRMDRRGVRDAPSDRRPARLRHSDVAVPGDCDSLGGAVARPELRRRVHALPASGAVARNSFHLLKIRVGPHIFWSAGPTPGAVARRIRASPRLKAVTR